MTSARTADVFIEAASTPTTKARTAEGYIEAAANPTTRARTATTYIEVVVKGGASLVWGWPMG